MPYSEQIKVVSDKKIERSIPVTNNRNVLNWIVDCQTNSNLNGQKSLSDNLLKELEDLFGSPNKSFRFEFKTKVWVLEYDDNHFNIFTSKGKGTSIEICGYNYDDINESIREKEIIEFIEELHRLVNSI